MHTWIDEEIGEQNAPHPEQNGAIADRIDHMIVNYLPSGIRCCCLSIAEFLGSGEGASFSGLLGPVRLVFGPLLYGVLFTPFVFAVLQESAMNRVAVDAFTSTDELSSSAWLAAFLFVGAVVLYVLIAFTSLPPYEPRSARLLLLLSSVILVVWIQQILTFRYILLRPELSELKKNRGEKHKYQLCGRAYSSLNPRNMINYIHLTVILSEFCILASVCFHSSIPWQQYGAREEEYLLADWLQTVLPQALVGVFLDGSSTARLVVLLLFCFAYLMVAGWAIFTRKHPASFSMALVCDGLAGTLYTTVVGRLLLSAYNMDGDRHIGRVLAMLGFFGFSTTAVFVATMRGDAGDSRSKRQPDVRFLPKCDPYRMPCLRHPDAHAYHISHGKHAHVHVHVTSPYFALMKCCHYSRRGLPRMPLLFRPWMRWPICPCECGNTRGPRHGIVRKYTLRKAPGCADPCGVKYRARANTCAFRPLPHIRCCRCRPQVACRRAHPQGPGRNLRRSPRQLEAQPRGCRLRGGAR